MSESHDLGPSDTKLMTFTEGHVQRMFVAIPLIL